MFHMNDENHPRMVTATEDEGVHSYLTRMYGYMSGAVLLSALSAVIVAHVFPRLMVATNSSMLGWLFIAVWFILPFVISHQAMKNSVAALLELAVFAIVTGVSFSALCVMYTGTTLGAAFVSSSAIFISMSIVGLTTRKDLARLGTQLFGAMIGLCVACLVNLFLHSSPIEFFISIASVIIFSLMVMYESHEFLAFYESAEDDKTITGLAINGALNLYMDFINIFIALLDIFGGFSNNNN